MSDGRIIPLTPELVDRRLSKAGPLVEHRERPPDSAWPHAEAAAVLATFDPEELEPTDAQAGTDSLSFLLANSLPVVEGTRTSKWRLQTRIRREALRRLGTREAIVQACERNPQAAGDGLREAFLEIAARPGGPDPRSLDYRALLLLGEATGLLDGILEHLPDRSAISVLIEREGVIEPLRKLAGSGFRGRHHELQQLADYVGVMPAGALRALRRTARTALRGYDRPPLLITGPGGIGKSTLLAKFILDHIEQGDVIFAYLDFDRPILSAAEPETILIEAARQLATQADAGGAGRWRELHAEWAEKPTRTAVELGSGGSRPGLMGQRILIDSFAAEFERTFGAKRPLLLALDTFEEVQFASADFADSLWVFLDMLSDRLPLLRTVLAGRAPIENRRCEIIALEALDKEAAVGFLEAHGVRDPAAAELLVKHLGCSPLTLSLAVEIMRHDQCELTSLEDVTRRQRLFVMNIDHKTMQIELYRRILSHIHDPDVERIAHPGLVLPRVTPELIRYVLAEPCGVSVGSDERARELFAKLADEVSLVRVADDGALEHRSDLRRAMLPLMREDAPEKVAAIHHLAIAFHAGRESDRDRAEEIYHRLAAGEEPERVDELWRPALRPLLRSLVSELPARAQAYLAGLVGVEIDPEAWQEASRRDVERVVEKRARDLLRVGRAQAALSVLRTAKDRQSGSPLYLCEAFAYHELGAPDAALEVIDRALEPAPARASGGTVLKLLSLAAHIEADRGAFEAAVERADDAYVHAAAREDGIAMLELGALRLRVCRMHAGRDRRRLATLHARAKETAEDVRALPTTTLASASDSVRCIMGEIGELSPTLFARLAETVGLPTLRPDRVRRIIIQWNHESRGGLEADAAALAVMQNPEPPTSGTAMDVLLGLLVRHPVTSGAARSIASQVRHALRESVVPGFTPESIL